MTPLWASMQTVQTTEIQLRTSLSPVMLLLLSRWARLGSEIKVIMGDILSNKQGTRKETCKPKHEVLLQNQVENDMGMS